MVLSGNGWKNNLQLPRSAFTSPHCFSVFACNLHKQHVAHFSNIGVYIQLYLLDKLLLLLQDDAGKAQDAATAMASLEGELEQATRREEQLRASRAQCEYQLQQAGEVAQSQVISTLHAANIYHNSYIMVAFSQQKSIQKHYHLMHAFSSVRMLYLGPASCTTCKACCILSWHMHVFHVTDVS